MSTSSQLATLRRSLVAVLAAFTLLILTSQPSDAHGPMPASDRSVAMVHQGHSTATTNTAVLACQIELQCYEETKHDHNASSSCCCGQACHSGIGVSDNYVAPAFMPASQPSGPITLLSAAPSRRIYHPPRRALTA